MLFRLVIAFLPRRKCLLISWLQPPSAVILEPKKIKSLTVSIVSLSTYHEVMERDAMIFIFWVLNFKPAFSLSSFTFIKKLLSSSSLSAIMWYHWHIWGFFYISPGNIDSSLCFIQSSILHEVIEYKLNKQGDYKQPTHTRFPYLNQSIIPCLIITVASWSAYRFLRRQVRCSAIPISRRIFSLLWCTQSKSLV